jgi:VWFA-related protein
MRLPIALLVAAASAVVMAQDRQPDQSTAASKQPTFRAEANYVRVDMYAMQDGRAVEDLKLDEIELLEDGAVQKIETFEHVHVRPAGPQETRIEPNTVRESRAMAADPRARVFVIFLDTYHTQVDGSHKMRLPVVRFLDRVIGQDDLVGVMTPEMSATQLTLGRKTAVISRMMQDDWTWGRRGQITEDPKELRYEQCYPSNRNDADSVAREMIDRRREKLSLDAIDDLVVHLRGLREERKAVLVISEGWTLFGENPRLARDIGDGVPGRPEVFVRGGKPSTSDPNTLGGTTKYECDADRLALARLDHRFRLQRLAEDANRANVSFYPVYPRGLAVFDAPLGPDRPPSPAEDRRNLASRQDGLRMLAENTDGLGVINTNDIEKGMARIVEDLTSYYLLGYYSTNTKLDGKFRSIKVRVARPGVDVRARRGYRGRTAEDLTNETRESAAKAMSTAIHTASVSPRSLLRIRTASWPTTASGDKTTAAVWIVGELDQRMRKDVAWSAGANADLVVVSATGSEVLTKTLQIDATQGMFSLRVPEAGGIPPGEYAVRVRVRPNQDGPLPVSDVARLIVPGVASRLGEGVMWRRGPTTGPRYLMTADPRFLRSERLRLEHATTASTPTVRPPAGPPTSTGSSRSQATATPETRVGGPGAGVATARLLDRAGRPMQVPVQVTDRQDPSGEFRWIVADATLAPLAAGDYAVEVTLGDAKVVTAFKVVP